GQGETAYCGSTRLRISFKRSGRQGRTAACSDLFEVRVDDVAVARLARLAVRAGSRLGPRRSALGLAVDGLADLLHGGRQLLAGGTHALDVVVLDRLLDRLDLAFDIGTDSRVELVSVLLQLLLGLVDETVRLVAGLDFLAVLAVFLGMGLGVAHHLRDLVLVERGRGG